jgi:predicted nucleic acid-binding protein
MRKHVVDTDLYVDFIRTGAHHALLQELYTHETPGIYFSSVVIEELLAGALQPAGRIRIEELYRPFERVDRILTPSHSDWKAAGGFLAWVRINHTSLRSKIPFLTNDALIAFSARSLGASLYTSNRADFELIARWRPFSIRFIDRELNSP